MGFVVYLKTKTEEAQGAVSQGVGRAERGSRSSSLVEPRGWSCFTFVSVLHRLRQGFSVLWFSELLWG